MPSKWVSTQEWSAADIRKGEMFHLVPIDQDWYEDKDYWVHYKFVDKPRRKPKMKVVYGGEAEMVKSK